MWSHIFWFEDILEKQLPICTLTDHFIRYACPLWLRLRIYQMKQNILPLKYDSQAQFWPTAKRYSGKCGVFLFHFRYHSDYASKYCLSLLWCMEPKIIIMVNLLGNQNCLFWYSTSSHFAEVFIVLAWWVLVSRTVIKMMTDIYLFKLCHQFSQSWYLINDENNDLVGFSPAPLFVVCLLLCSTPSHISFLVTFFFFFWDVLLSVCVDFSRNEH